MKDMTLAQRLTTALMVLSVLLVVCVGLALWIEREHSGAISRSERLSDHRDRIEYDVMLMSDTLRGLLLDPKPRADTEKKPHDPEGEILADLKQNFEDLAKVTSHTALLASAGALHDFIFGPLTNFHAVALKMLQDDPVAATAYYLGNHSALERQRNQLLADLATQVNSLQRHDAEHAADIALWGGIGIGVILVASLFIGFKQSSDLAAPLNQLVKSMERLRQGDFTQRLRVERKDEFGILGEGLNRLADELSELVGQVQRSGIQVNTTATQIAASAKQQQSTAHEIAATTAQIGATSKEISATSKELVKTMNEVNQVAEDTANLAGSGQTAIARMESTMRQIMDASGSITAKLAVLSEKTANINSVVTTITKVADQTNLLSLNAAIEAEKAGEYGLGFAVVAMEVRRLADQTAVATYDIERMVKEMQSAVAAGVMGMDKFSEEVRRGVEEIRQVSTHLAQIIHQVQTLTPRFQTVNEGMHAQATGAQQISETLTQLSEAAQQTADSLRQSNQAIEQLNGAARGLQTSVARFKLGI